MLGIHDLWLFIISGLLLNVTPGPDTAYIVGRSMQLGWRGGAAAALGICCRLPRPCVRRAIGLSALSMASSTAFTVVKWAGAAYPALIGLQMLLSRTGPTAEAAAQARCDARCQQVFWQGALTNVLNPKVALFFLAFLPQFVEATRRTRRSPSCCSALIFIFNGTLWCLAIAAFAAKPPRASGNRQGRSAGSIVGLAGCSSISAFASRCWRRAKRRCRQAQPWMRTSAAPAR